MADWVQPALRFLHYSELLGLFGWVAFPLIGLRNLPLVQIAPTTGLVPAVGITAPMISIALMLVSIGAMMGRPLRSLDGSMIAAMIFETDLGRAFLVRLGLLLLGLAALFAHKRVTSAPVIATACFAGAIMTLGWSGHAAASEGALGLLHRIGNGVHLLAAGLWLGAIGWFLNLIVKLPRHSAPEMGQSLLAAMQGFTPLGVTLVALVCVTGLANAHFIFGLENSTQVLTTGYGQLLAAKVALVIAMLGFASRNAWLAHHHARATTREALDGTDIRAALNASLGWEICFGVTLVGLVAILGMMSPTMMP